MTEPQKTTESIPVEKPWYAPVNNETPSMLQNWLDLLDKQLADPNTQLTELVRQDIAKGRIEIAARLAQLQPQEAPTQ